MRMIIRMILWLTLVGCKQVSGPSDLKFGGTDTDTGTDTCTCSTNDDCCDGCRAKNEEGSCDELACTEDQCRAGSCEQELLSGYCLISGDCHPHNANDSANECRYCDVPIATDRWTNRTIVTDCNDGNNCTEGDKCNGAGSCEGAEVVECINSDGCCPSDCTAADDVDCCEAAECSQIADSCCPGSCAALTDIDCCEDGATSPGAATDTEWVTICGGTYLQGSETGGDDEEPLHEVTVPSFEMLETEVTVAQYGECVNDNGSCTAPGTYGSCNWEAGDGYQDHPVNCVDWAQSEAFCNWIGGRLASESEWEYAARSGGQDIKYPWGDETATCDYAVMDDSTHSYGCDTERTWSVCSKTIGNTTQGLCDMAGNVWEWVQDVLHGSYDCVANPSAANCSSGGKAPADGSAWEGSGSGRVTRGGSFVNYGGDYLRAAYRSSDDPSSANDSIGFRCAR